MQLPDEQIQALLEAIAASGRIYAKAKANAKAMEELRKTTKAMLVRTARLSGEPVTMAESAAYTNPQYAEVDRKLFAAIEDEVVTQVDYENTVREWESWRTLCANERNIR